MAAGVGQRRARAAARAHGIGRDRQRFGRWAAARVHARRRCGRRRRRRGRRRALSAANRALRARDTHAVVGGRHGARDAERRGAENLAVAREAGDAAIERRRRRADGARGRRLQRCRRRRLGERPIADRGCWRAGGASFTVFLRASRQDRRRGHERHTHVSQRRAATTASCAFGTSGRVLRRPSWHNLQTPP